MATRDFDQGFDGHNLSEDFDETFLPPFPTDTALLDVLPDLARCTTPLTQLHLVPWVDLTLEQPDEIWEFDAPSGKRMYYYVSYLEDHGTIPAFVVEVSSGDELTAVNNFGLLVIDSDLQEIRTGHRIYSLVQEWEKEKVVRALNEKALRRYDENRLDEARHLIDSAIRLSGSASAYLFNNRGLICWKMGQTDQAKQDFLESINLDRENGDPYFNIGLIYLDETDFHQALEFLSRAVDLNPRDSQFLTELGHLYLEMDREADAFQLFRRAFETNPRDAQIDFHLGHYFLYKKRKPRHAVKHYCKGLEKEPDDQFALADLAVAHWNLGHVRQALKIHKLLQEGRRLMPYTISRLVYLNVEMGNYEGALEYYREALSHKDPFEPEWLHFNAALVYARTGRSQLALDKLGLAVKVGGEAVIRRAMADEALQRLMHSADFKRLFKTSTRRRNR
jgi:tetratricopeptide (TPR) repeat protein